MADAALRLVPLRGVLKLLIHSFPSNSTLRSARTPQNESSGGWKPRSYPTRGDLCFCCLKSRSAPVGEPHVPSALFNLVSRLLRICNMSNRQSEARARARVRVPIPRAHVRVCMYVRVRRRVSIPRACIRVRVYARTYACTR